MFKIMQMRFLFFPCFIIALSACGGGGGGDDGGEVPFDNAVFVNAGADRFVNEESVVTLSGEVQSNDTDLTYAWSVSPNLPITHEDTASPAATFTSPAVTENTEYVFTLSVSGGAGGRGQDDQVITVLPINASPVAAITVPAFVNADTGFLPAGERIELGSSQSTDADAPDPERQIRVWQWQQTAGTDVLSASETDQPELIFTAPVLPERETISLTLTVTDAEGASDTTQVDLVLLAASETPPIITGGLDQFVFSGETIVLAGVVDTTVPDAMPLAVSWESDISLQIDSDITADTFAIAPLVDVSTDVVMTLVVVDNFGNQVTDTINVNVRPSPIPKLNDTGVTLHGTENEIITSHQNAFPGQDAQRGQDQMALNGVLEKAGRGRVGFDYTALNENGDEMDDLSEPWSCVRDNTTGLVWEVKSEEALLHYTDATYSWYFAENNGGFEGNENATGTVCSLNICNTESYLFAVNQFGLCGFFDWRLPNHDELMSIVDFGSTSGAKTDETYFPQVGDTTSGPLWYWTRQPGADGVANANAQNAWALDFATGVDNFLNKSTPARIRLVRAGR